MGVFVHDRACSCLKVSQCYDSTVYEKTEYSLPAPNLITMVKRSEDFMVPTLFDAWPSTYSNIHYKVTIANAPILFSSILRTSRFVCPFVFKTGLPFCRQSPPMRRTPAKLLGYIIIDMGVLCEPKSFRTSMTYNDRSTVAWCDFDLEVWS